MSGLARALSKLGHCSRRQAMALVAAGRVRVNGAGVRDPERPVVPGRDRIEVDGQPVVAAAAVYLMLNKPRGLVTTARHGVSLSRRCGPSVCVTGWPAGPGQRNVLQSPDEPPKNPSRPRERVAVRQQLRP